MRQRKPSPVDKLVTTDTATVEIGGERIKVDVTKIKDEYWNMVVMRGIKSLHGKYGFNAFDYQTKGKAR